MGERTWIRERECRNRRRAIEVIPSPFWNDPLEGSFPVSTCFLITLVFAWASHYCSGESRVIIIFRGILGALLLVAVPIFAVIVLVIEPVYETGLTPFKGMKSHGFPHDFKPSEQPVWNVVIVSYSSFCMRVFIDCFLYRWGRSCGLKGETTTPISRLLSVSLHCGIQVSVAHYTLSDYGTYCTKDPSSPPCTLDSEASGQTHPPDDKFAYDRLQFHCPPRIQITKGDFLT